MNGKQKREAEKTGWRNKTKKMKMNNKMKIASSVYVSLLFPNFDEKTKTKKNRKNLFTLFFFFFCF